LGTLTKKNNLEEVYTTAAKVLEMNNKDFPCAIIYKIDEEKKIAEAFAFAGIDKDHPELPKIIDIEHPGMIGQNLSRAVKENKLVVSDTLKRWKDLPKGFWNVMAKHFVHVPISHPNKKYPLAVVSAALNPYRKFDEAYRNFVQLAADQISLEVKNVLALEEERKRAEVLAEIDKAKTLFFTNVSHEFRTPLTLMLGPIEEALKDPNAVSDNVARMNVAHRNALRLLKLVNTLLDFSRIESGRQKANFMLTDVGSFTKSLAANFRSIIEKAGLELNINAESFIQPLYIDREMWEKIVFNLLSNAFKYTIKGGITVELSAEKNFAVLKIKDTGVGIPENELPHMFERFHRVENVTGRTYEGTGIGLSLIKEFVQLHGGSISVESKSGVGSTFSVTIPFGKAHLPSSQIKNEDNDFADIISDVYIEEAATLLGNVAVENELKGLEEDKEFPLVMIVDDNADMRRHLQTLLAGKFRTITAHNGMHALQQLREVIPDLILSDIMMPVMDGIKLLKEIKSNKKTEQVPVVLLTARAGEESKIEGWETGADDYLVKPFSSKELVARIDAQIKIKQKRDTILQNVYNLFDEVPFAIAVLKGEDLIIEFINRYNVGIWQCSKEEVTGKPLFEARPDIRKGAEWVHAEVYRTGKRCVINDLPLELTVKGKTQTRYFNAIIDPQVNEDGKIIGQLATSIEVTDQVLARKKIEEANRQLQFAATLGQSIPDAVVGTLPAEENYLITTWNKGAETTYGWKADEAIGKPVSAVLQTIFRSEEERKISEAALAGNGYWKGEVTQKTKDGREIITLASIAYIKSAEGKILGAVGVNRDITKLKEAETALGVAKEQLEITFKNIPAGIYQLNSKGRLEYINERGAALMGYNSVEEVMEHNMEQLKKHVDEKFIVLDETGKEMTEEKGTIYIAIKTRKHAEAVFQFINKETGKSMWILSNSTPVYDDNGELSFVLTIATDVTSSKTAEIALRESEERFRTLAETLPQMVWMRNADGNIEYASKAWEIYSGKKDVSEAWRTMVHPDDWERVMNSWEKDSASGTSFRYEVRLKNREGEYRWHHAAGEPVKDQSGKIIKWIGALTDIHVQKTFAEKLEDQVAQRTEELLKANKELESFNYIASHDLQEPLRKIQTFIALIERNRENNEIVQKYFEKIRSSAERMSDLIRSILAYSQLSKTSQEYSLTDLNQILDDVKNDFELLIKERDALIKSDKLPVIRSNPLQMHQLFANLISNSLKFSNHKPEITIDSRIITGDKITVNGSVNPDQKFVHLTFADNGIGFQPEFKEQIFQLFQRLHNRAQYSGTGIGLSIVKRIIEQHKGFIAADSVPGQGAIFNVWLPLEQNKSYDH
jgi:PAS domain S-box-containing protein